MSTTYRVASFHQLRPATQAQRIRDLVVEVPARQPVAAAAAAAAKRLVSTIIHTPFIVAPFVYKRECASHLDSLVAQATPLENRPWSN
jgi:hypothetical protein